MLVMMVVQETAIVNAVPVNSDKPKNIFENSKTFTMMIIEFNIISCNFFLELKMHHPKYAAAPQLIVNNE